MFRQIYVFCVYLSGLTIIEMKFPKFPKSPKKLMEFVLFLFALCFLSFMVIYRSMGMSVQKTTMEVRLNNK